MTNVNSGEGGSQRGGEGGTVALEPHHEAARHRTDDEDAALTDRVSADEFRGLRRAGDNPIRTVYPTGGLL